MVTPTPAVSPQRPSTQTVTSPSSVTPRTQPPHAAPPPGSSTPQTPHPLVTPTLAIPTVSHCRRHLASPPPHPRLRHPSAPPSAPQYAWWGARATKAAGTAGTSPPVLVPLHPTPSVQRSWGDVGNLESPPFWLWVSPTRAGDTRGGGQGPTGVSDTAVPAAPPPPPGCTPTPRATLPLGSPWHPPPLWGTGRAPPPPLSLGTVPCATQLCVCVCPPRGGMAPCLSFPISTTWRRLLPPPVITSTR